MARTFDLNKNMADEAIKAFNQIKDNIDSECARVIGWALTKLNLLEEQGFEIVKGNYDYINHPLHYKTDNGRECIDDMIDIWGTDKVALWCNMTAYKYQVRKGKKPNNKKEDDEKKIDWYLRKAKELQSYDEGRN